MCFQYKQKKIINESLIRDICGDDRQSLTRIKLLIRTAAVAPDERGLLRMPQSISRNRSENINSLEMSRISESDSHDDVMSRDDFKNSFYAIVGFVHRKWIAPEFQCGKYHLHDVHDEVRLVKQAAPAILTTFINSPYFFSPSFRYLFDGTSLLIINLKQAFPCSL